MSTENVRFISDETATAGPDAPDSWGYAGPGWYFWDETEAYCYGPYPDGATATTRMGEYARDVLGCG